MVTPAEYAEINAKITTRLKEIGEELDALQQELYYSAHALDGPQENEIEGFVKEMRESLDQVGLALNEKFTEHLTDGTNE